MDQHGGAFDTGMLLRPGSLPALFQVIQLSEQRSHLLEGSSDRLGSDRNPSREWIGALIVVIRRLGRTPNNPNGREVAYSTRFFRIEERYLGEVVRCASCPSH